MSTEHARQMLDLLQELALLKQKKPANREERRLFENRRKEIRAAMLSLGQQERDEKSDESSAA